VSPLLAESTACLYLLSVDCVPILLTTVHKQRVITQQRHNLFTDAEKAPAFNADLERLKCDSLTPQSAAVGKELLKKKWNAKGERGVAAYFEQQKGDLITYAEVFTPATTCRRYPR
jgi:hypothetical protein